MKRTFAAFVVNIAIVLPVFAQDIKQINTIQEQHGVTAIALAPDGKSLAFADKDNQLLVRPVDGSRRLLIGRHSAAFLSLAFSADGKKIASLTADKLVQVWDSPDKSDTAKPIATHKVETAAGLVAFEPNGAVMLAHVVTGQDGNDNFAEVRLLDLPSGKHRIIRKATTPVALPGIKANFQLLAFSADGKALAVSTSDAGGTISKFLFFTATGAQRNVPAHMQDDNILTVSEAGVILVAAGKNGLSCWNYAAAEVTASGKVNPRLAAISANGRILVAVDAKNIVTTFELPEAHGKPDPTVMNARRLKGMKDAITDLEKGSLKQKMFPPPAPPWWEVYVGLLKKECAVEIVYVKYDESLTAMAAYNAVMLLEIEHRFGQDILGRLSRKAENDFKVRQGK